jgi:hypothetical protein
VLSRIEEKEFNFMPLLSREELKILATQPDGLRVSMYMPAHKEGLEVQQNPIRYKNLIGEAQEKLVEAGLKQSEAEKMLEPARALHNDEFWRHQSGGLAVFVGSDFFSYYCLPLEFEQLVVVSDQFHLKPLMPLLTGDGRFYLLALSQNQVRLLEGTRDIIREIKPESVGDLPESLQQALQYEGKENQTQFMSSATYSPAGLSGSNPGTLHGRGVDEDKYNQLVRFFSQVNQGLQDYLQDGDVPLVLAGVEFLMPIYKQVNTYPNVLEEGVTGNPEALEPEELHAQAWTIVQPYFQQAQKEAAERYAEFTGNNPTQASDDLKEILKAAYYQRVDSLFVTLGYQQWGNFDAENQAVEMHDQEQPGDEDLLDVAAIHTLINGGTVYAVPREHVPADSPVAAVFRY